MIFKVRPVPQRQQHRVGGGAGAGAHLQHPMRPCGGDGGGDRGVAGRKHRLLPVDRFDQAHGATGEHDVGAFPLSGDHIRQGGDAEVEQRQRIAQGRRAGEQFVP